MIIKNINITCETKKEVDVLDDYIVVTRIKIQTKKSDVLCQTAVAWSPSFPGSVAVSTNIRYQTSLLVPVVIKIFVTPVIALLRKI